MTMAMVMVMMMTVAMVTANQTLSRLMRGLELSWWLLLLLLLLLLLKLPRRPAPEWWCVCCRERREHAVPAHAAGTPRGLSHDQPARVTLHPGKQALQASMWHHGVGSRHWHWHTDWGGGGGGGGGRKPFVRGGWRWTGVWVFHAGMKSCDTHTRTHTHTRARAHTHTHKCWHQPTIK